MNECNFMMNDCICKAKKIFYNISTKKNKRPEIAPSRLPHIMKQSVT